MNFNFFSSKIYTDGMPCPSQECTHRKNKKLNKKNSKNYGMSED